MPLPSNIWFIVSILALSASIGPSIVIRDANSETRLDFAALTTLALVICIIIKSTGIIKNLKKFSGKTFRFPQYSPSAFDGIWISIIPSLISFRRIGEPITSMKGKVEPSWEFAWGMSPSLPYAAAAIFIGIFVFKLHDYTSRASHVA